MMNCYHIALQDLYEHL